MQPIKSNYFNKEKKELDDLDVIARLEGAIADYRDGAIIECRDALLDIIKAIDQFCKESEE